MTLPGAPRASGRLPIWRLWAFGDPRLVWVVPGGLDTVHQGPSPACPAVR